MKPPLLKVRLSCETCDRTIDAWARHVITGGHEHYRFPPLHSEWIDVTEVRGVSFTPNPDGSPSRWTWSDAVGATCPECSVTPTSGAAGEG